MDGKYETIFNINDMNIKLTSNNSKIIDDLNKLYGNYYDTGNSADFCINYVVGSGIKTDIPYKEKNQSKDNYVGLDGYSFNVYIDSYTRNDRDFIKRIFTTVLIKLLQLNGYTIMHGACIVKDDKAIIISGNKRAGKTTTMLNLLEHGYDYIANDRIAIKKENDDIVVVGIPFSMGIIKEDVNMNNDFNQFKTEKDGAKEKIYFENYQISEILNVSIQSTAIVKSIIIPSYDKDIEALNISRINNPVDYLEDNIMTDNCIPKEKSFLNDIFKVNYGNCDFINLIPTYLIVQNKHTFDDLANFIENNIIKGEDKNVLRLTRTLK